MIFETNKYIYRNGYRSSRPEVFCKKGVLRNFAKFTEKHLCQSLFFNKVAGLRPATLLKKRLWHRCFSVNFAKFLRTSFIIEHLWWLLLWLSEWMFTVKVHKGRPKFYKFPRDGNLKQEWLIKIKRRNIQSIQRAECVILIASAKILAGKRCDFSWHQIRLSDLLHNPSPTDD